MSEPEPEPEPRPEPGPETGPELGVAGLRLCVKSDTVEAESPPTVALGPRTSGPGPGSVSGPDSGSELRRPSVVRGLVLSRSALAVIAPEPSLEPKPEREPNPAPRV